MWASASNHFAKNYRNMAFMPAALLTVMAPPRSGNNRRTRTARCTTPNGHILTGKPERIIVPPDVAKIYENINRRKAAEMKRKVDRSRAGGVHRAMIQDELAQ